MLSDLAQSLAKLGLSHVHAASVVQYAQLMPSDGVAARCAQLHFGVSNGVITAEEANTLVHEQPEFLRCEYTVAYKDEHLVAVDKPWDALLSPDKRGPRWDGEVSLRDWLREAHPETMTEDGSGEVRLCHNLDFATSGVIVAAKSKVVANDVSRCFRERVARKLYCALVFGHPSWDACTWDARIQPSTRKFKQRISGGGKKAETEVFVGARGRLRVGEHAGREASLLWLTPHTGRRHQLRLHCAHGGHPIVGDLTYADDRLMYRMFLHAAALELPLESAAYQPDAPVRVEAPLVPAGWADVFELDDTVSSPEGWPGAAERLHRG